MNIREYIRVRATSAIGLFLIVFVCAVVARYVAGESVLVWLIAIVLIGFWATSFYVKFVITCPKCHMPPGSDSFGIAFPFLALTPRNFCQSCGTNVDEPLDRDS